MQCDSARNLMFDALDGADAALLGRHVQGCRACREEWEALVAVDRLLRGQGLVDPPRHFTSRAMAFIDAETRRRPAWQLGLMTVGAVAVGTVLSCVAAVALLGGGLAVLARLGVAPDPGGTLRQAALAVGVFAEAVRAGVLFGVGYMLLAALVAVAWFGALVVPRHSPARETAEDACD